MLESPPSTQRQHRRPLEPLSGLGQPPPRLSVGEAVRRHLGLVLAPPVVLAVLALALVIVRPPVYTAESTVSIGRLDVSQPGAVSGFASATKALAETYSRAIGADGVTRPLARQAGLSVPVVSSRVSAAPVPETPVFNISAEGPTREAAIDLSNGATDALIAYVERLNRSNPNSKRLAEQYAQAVEREESLRERVRRLRGGTEAATLADTDSLSEAQGAYETAKLETETLGASYRASRQGLSSASVLQVLSSADEAVSDRLPVFQQYLFVAVLAGLAIGLALAVRRANNEAKQLTT